jgi:phosphoglucomutase
LDEIVGKEFAGLTVTQADQFSYTDPVDGSIATGQGIRVMFEGDARLVLRMSGTGTTGATLRLYLERLETDAAQLTQDPQLALGLIIAAAEEIVGFLARLGREKPDVIT